MRSGNLVELKSLKAQHEVGLIYLIRRQSEIQKQVEATEQQRNSGVVYRDAASHVQRNLETVTIEIERKRLVISEIDQKIVRLESIGVSATASDLTGRDDDASAELAQIRAAILVTLKSLADPLNRFAELSEEKVRLARQLSQITGRDTSYATYIDSALLRQAEYDDRLKFVVEYLKKARVAS